VTRARAAWLAAGDLGPWNGSLFAHYPDRAFYRYAPREPGSWPVFVPLDREAALRGVE